MKTIRLRGISRKPSDRNNSDGGCSDSINMCVIQEELAPMPAPRNVTSELIGTGNSNDRIVYIHHVGSQKNYITVNSSGQIRAYINQSLSPVIVTLSGAFKEVSAIGNILIVSSSMSLHYVSWKDGEYTYLGTKIPEPRINVKATPATTISDASAFVDDILYKTGWSLVNGATITLGDSTYTGTGALLAIILKGETQESYTISSGTYAGSEFRCSEYVARLTDYMWTKVAGKRANARSEHKFCSPVFVRYALKLYDGSYIYQSVPVLLHNGSNFSVRESLQGVGEITIMSNIFTVGGNITFDYDGWDDIVRSVDIFLSTNIDNPVTNARPVGGYFETLAVGEDPVLTLRFKDQTEVAAEDMAAQILSKNNFYLVKSVDVSDIPSTGLAFTLDPRSQDDLVVQPTLNDDYLSHHEVSASGHSMVYNSRLAFNGGRTSLYQGHPFLPSEVYTSGHTSKSWRFKFFVKTDNGEVYTVISGEVRNSAIGAGYGQPRGWIYYPDPRCYKVEVYDGSTTAYSIVMTVHPGLNGSYAVWDLGESYDEPGSAFATSGWPAGESPTFEEKNTILMSEPNNPFLFRYSGRLSFPGEVITMATTTKALSTGQFGQFPLYVFTRDGIWAVPISDEGAFMAPKILSLDVTLSAGSVTPIDQAIVFTTSRGVHMLTDSSVRPISQDMMGASVPVSYDEVSYLWDGLDWEDLEAAAEDMTPFIDYMSTARCLYDYAGARLIFINDERDYLYVFMLESETWHKMVTLGHTISSILNSYPETIVCVKGFIAVGQHDGYGLFDYSGCFSQERDIVDPDRQSLVGVTVTRAMDFDEPFVLKSLTDIKVRGFIDRNDDGRDKVRYLILASNDGVHFGLLSSLRGKAYKFFKFVILSGLYIDERISWLEVEYDRRRNNKMR